MGSEMKGYIEIPEVPNACIVCDYHENYKCHAVGEYFPRYSAEVWQRPRWCPIKMKDDFKINDPRDKGHSEKLHGIAR